MKLKFNRWAIVFESKNDRHFMFNNLKLLHFKTKKEAKDYIKENYNYFKRKDLKSEPHFWRIPKAVKVKIMVDELDK